MSDDVRPDASSPDSQSIFSPSSHSIIIELDRQLEEWRSCLPQGLEFPGYFLGQEHNITKPYQARTTHERLRGHLMARYYSAKTVIHRAFVYRVLHSENPELLPESERNGAQTAIGAAFLSTIHSGLSYEPLALLLHPINSCRRFVISRKTFYVDKLKKSLPQPLRPRSTDSLHPQKRNLPLPPPTRLQNGRRNPRPHRPRYHTYLPHGSTRWGNPPTSILIYWYPRPSIRPLELLLHRVEDRFNTIVSRILGCDDAELCPALYHPLVDAVVPV